MVAHQWYIFARSPDAFFAFALKLVTDPLQLAPERLTRPGLLLPFFFPSAKLSSIDSISQEFEILGVLDKLDKIGKEGVQKELSKIGIQAEQIQKLLNLSNYEILWVVFFEGILIGIFITYLILS